MALNTVRRGRSKSKTRKIISLFRKKMSILNISDESNHSLPFKKEQTMKRTTHRSSSGKKLYAVRDSKGRFLDIQTYERAHRMDLKKKSKAEKAKAAKKKK